MRDRLTAAKRRQMLWLPGMANLAAAVRMAGQSQRNGALFLPIGRLRHDRNRGVAIRELEVEVERAVGLERDRLAIDPESRFRVGASVKDHLRVHVHEEIAAPG